MTRSVHLVSTWKNPDSPVYHPEPAKLTIGSEWAVFEVVGDDWPDGLDHDDVVGWPIVASERDADKQAGIITPCSTVYEGEIREVATKARMTGLVRRLKCKPAVEAGQQILPQFGQTNQP